MIDVLAAAIEYGLDGLVKVMYMYLDVHDSLLLIVFAAVCSLHARFNRHGDSLRVPAGINTPSLPYSSLCSYLLSPPSP